MYGFICGSVGGAAVFLIANPVQLKFEDYEQVYAVSILKEQTFGFWSFFLFVEKKNFLFCQINLNILCSSYNKIF